MASVINSARTSTASVFDVIGTAARSIDALDHKAKLMHKGIVADTNAKLVNIENHTIVNAAVEHADFMEGIFKRKNPGKDFDWNQCYDDAVSEIQAAVKAA